MVEPLIIMMSFMAISSDGSANCTLPVTVIFGDSAAVVRVTVGVEGAAVDGANGAAMMINPNMYVNMRFILLFPFVCCRVPKNWGQVLFSLFRATVV